MLKLMTALVSATTAIILFPLVPKLVALPSPAELEASNDRLRAEIARHEATLAELEAIRAQLEETVEERTRALTESNERLTVVSRETVHRAKNLLTVVQSIARQSASDAGTKDDLVETLTGRMASLGRALTAVIDRGSGSAELGEIVAIQLEHYTETYPGRIRIAGPALEIRAEAAQQIGLATHELATNAVKHGALSASGGRVDLSWRLNGDEVEFVWQESGETAPNDATLGGFGSILLTRAVPMQLRGAASAEMRERGLHYRLPAPLSQLRPQRQHGEPPPDVAQAFPQGA